MQPDDALADREAVERASDPSFALRAELKAAVAERSGVRQTQARAVLNEEFNDPCVVGKHVDRP